MRADPARLLMGWLRAQPEFGSTKIQPVRGSIPVGGSWIKIDVIDGERVVRDKADSWDVMLTYFGPDKATVTPTALMVRELILERLPGSRYTLDGKATVVADVFEWFAPSDFDDEDSVEGEHRMVHKFEIFIYQ